MPDAITCSTELNLSIATYTKRICHKKHTYIHPFNGSLSRTTRVSRYQKGKTNLDFTEARGSEWHQLGHMQVCTLLQTDNHAITSPLSFLQAGCPSCRPTNSIKSLKAKKCHKKVRYYIRCCVNHAQTSHDSMQTLVRW